jgi:hypothetical protein
MAAFVTLLFPGVRIHQEFSHDISILRSVHTPIITLSQLRKALERPVASNLSMIPCAILEIISLCLNLSAISCLAGNALQKTSGDNAGVFKVFTGGETSSRIFPCNKNNMGCIDLFPPSSASMAVSPRSAILFPANLLHPEFRFRTLVKINLVIIIDKFALPQYGHIICYSLFLNMTKRKVSND